MKDEKIKVREISRTRILSMTTFLVLAFPLLSFAAPFGQLVPDCGAQCGWNDLAQLAQNLLNFMIYMSVPIAAIAFAYAGWLYLSARGNPGDISKAHSIFMNVAIGLIIVLVAWLVVDQLLKALTVSGSYVEVLRN